MQEAGMFRIRVPASTANLGPGFDSIGLALNLYLEVYGSLSDKWEITPLTEDMKQFPADETNFIVQIAMKTAAFYGKELPPCRLFVSSEIPLARGLGSSASAIVAGIELADTALALHLSAEEKSRHASSFEGHPDNAGASVFGGLVVGYHAADYTKVIHFPVEDLAVMAVIPDFELLTEDSRNVLPAHLTYQDAIRGSAASNLLVAAAMTNDWSILGKMMQRDPYHQPYRARLVPHLRKAEEIAGICGAYGTALSGAGPTVLSLVEENRTETLKHSFEKAFPSYDIRRLGVDNIGSQVSVLSSEEFSALDFSMLR
ncbi:homoserine kinase [Bacillus massiliglaciei]|uniref:homoserine kinase n=1 Tax=Bacillus massiliglaciei TaxID=1816693 RepID=UPI000DA61168|nr:homoserine kinase [Bacillus massiliglaciei]